MVSGQFDAGYAVRRGRRFPVDDTFMRKDIVILTVQHEGLQNWDFGCTPSIEGLSNN